MVDATEMLCSDSLPCHQKGTQVVAPAPKPKQGFFSSTMVDLVAGASSILIGGITFWREVLAESYSNFTDLKFIEPIKKKFRGNFAGEIDALVQSGSLTAEQAAKKIIEHNRDYHAAVKARFEQFTMNKFSNRWALLNSHEKWKIGLTSLAVTGVALGSILLLGKEMLLGDKKDETPKPDIQPRPASFVEATQQQTSSQQLGVAG